jgi:hypothetical protein
MNHALLTLKVRTKRDVLRARQRARQIARLLGYEPVEQSWIAASVFDMARKAMTHRAVLRIELQPDLLRISVQSCDHESRDFQSRDHEGAIALPLPDGRSSENASSLDRHDLPWIIQQLNRITPVNLFEEFHQQNLEMLHLASLWRSQSEGAMQGPSSA